MASWTVGRVVRSMLYGFQREFRSYERTAVDAALNMSPDRDRLLLSQQFDARERLQRNNLDRVVSVDIQDRGALPKLSTMAEEYMYAAIDLRGRNGTTTLKVLLYKGVFTHWSSPFLQLLWVQARRMYLL